MPSGTSNDKPQQPKSSGFPSSSNLLPTKNIWNTSGYQPAHARVPSLTSKDSADNGAGVIHTTSESNGWYPWNDESARSTSTSPKRTRDNGLSRVSAFGNGAEAHNTIGYKNGFNGVKNGFPEASAGRQKRSSHDTAYLDSMSSFSSSREPSATPSRQSQASPAFPDLYNSRAPGHSHSNSFQSHRALPNHSVSISHQAVNSRAFGINKQLDDDLSVPFAGRRVPGTEHAAPGANVIDPSAAGFQFNPGSQPFADAGAARFTNGHDGTVDGLANKFSALGRPSSERVSPQSSYRLDGSTSPGLHAQAGPEMWNNRGIRDPRTADFERRGSAPGVGTPYGAQYFPPQQYPFSNLAPQFSPSYLEPYNQGFRHAMLPNYPLPFPTGYPLGGNLPPIRPAADHDPTRSMRSAVLEDYKNNKNKRWELKDFYTYMVEFSGDQHGSRFIQMKLETANSDEKDQVFREIEPNAIQLMKDVFGNYVVQKFFEHGNQVQKKMLAEKIKSKMVDLSLQVYACRVVQKALEHVLVDQQLEMVKELEPETLRVMMDQNGNHVIQKIVGLLDRKYLGFMMNALRGQVMMLSNHQYGCRVVQRMMDYGTEEDNNVIVGELRSSAHLLLPDQYGNYVAQHIIVHGKFEDRLKMVSLVLEQLVDLCKHKFASNVVETCIIHGVPELRTMIREQFEKMGSDGSSVLQQLMRDSYGNYVIQKMATWLEGEEQDNFVEQIKPIFYTLKKTANSRQITAMEKMLDQHSRCELKPDPKQYGHVAAVAPAPGITQESSEAAPLGTSRPAAEAAEDATAVTADDQSAGQQ